MAIEDEAHDESSSHTELRWLADEQLVWCVIRTDPHDVDQARENIEGIMRLRDKLGRTKVRVVVDVRHVRTMSRPARAFYANQYTASVTRAVALIADDGVGRILANFFLGLNRPLNPIRLVETPEAAVKWLHEFSPD